MSLSNSGVGKWAAGVLATVLSGVIVFYLTEGSKKDPSAPPTPAPFQSSNPQHESLLPRPQIADVSGGWHGRLYQQLPDGSLAPFDYRLDLSQNGNSVEGTATLQFPQPYAYSVVMRIRGALSGNQLTFDDGQMLANTAPAGLYWCQKAVRLSHNATAGTLEGTWSQSGCGSGQVMLSR